MFRLQTILVLLLIVFAAAGQGAARGETISLPAPPDEDVPVVTDTSARGTQSPAFLAYQARLAARADRAREILRARNRYAAAVRYNNRNAGYIPHSYLVTDRLGFVQGSSVAAALYRQLG
ncbi:MAG: hypothetical protein AAFU85_10570, partial [Planctomycetota bacterium]